ncbi:endonuclease/exonuclease/phosphatase family protein [Massilia sp. YIM B02769]|uniref:endonuclease/exonuclease/phosphatase family protein n=1 Tax=Massilia sp. YIM B02769 TaxID=3050129 RepID=UPI0025B673F7|nr:endonuclease/exonuclease/phosphatase family protein [Massilia sp. YIM B02769]MDN4057995.1 endonuclease/exonuclease/phosphatase family protein [Massilia sp. YIM B02769]
MRVVSWNIHWGCGRDGRIRIHAIIDVLRKLNPDVICLQEVAANHPELEGSATANQFKQLAGAFGGYHAIDYAPSEIYRNNVPRLFGNLILSKYRITQAHRHSLPWPFDPVSPGMPRGAIEVVLDTPRGKLRVVTTHLEYYSRLQRAAQVGRLRELHAQACARSRAFQPNPEMDAPFQLGELPAAAIYCGDFNLQPGSEEYEALLAPPLSGELALVDAWRARHPDHARAPTAGLHGFAWPEKPDCYDYFFVTEDLLPRIGEVEVQSETGVSDHQPIVLDLV